MKRIRYHLRIAASVLRQLTDFKGMLRHARIKTTSPEALREYRTALMRCAERQIALHRAGLVFRAQP